jgi:GTP pyrophosphokinase
VRVTCKDKKGLLAEISNNISGLDINIAHAKVDTSPEQNAMLDFQLEIRDLNQFNQLSTTLKKLRSVISVERLRRS